MKHCLCNFTKARFPKILYCALFTFIATLPVKSRAQTADEKAISKLLENQSKGWNNGNIEEYMKGYWQSDSLVFIGKNGLRYGYTNTLNSYKKSYPDTTSMGKLHFNLLQLKKLSFEYFSIIGQWQLRRSIGNLEGYFTLLLKKINNHWVIISDHSS